jgi:hypothetical protein
MYRVPEGYEGEIDVLQQEIGAASDADLADWEMAAERMIRLMGMDLYARCLADRCILLIKFERIARAGRLR